MAITALFWQKAANICRQPGSRVSAKGYWMTSFSPSRFFYGVKLTLLVMSFDISCWVFFISPYTCPGDNYHGSLFRRTDIIGSIVIIATSSLLVTLLAQ
ncbi:hypothetical protein V8F33_006355 [Rhypophila sp. PSN 637]